MSSSDFPLKIVGITGIAAAMLKTKTHNIHLQPTRKGADSPQNTPGLPHTDK